MARRFPLEAVLRLRRMQEEAKLKEFASFVRVRAREQGTLDTLQEALLTSRGEMSEQARAEGLPSQKAQMYLAYFSAQNAKIRYQRELVRKVDAEIRRKRREMTFAINRRKIFDRLKEKHLAALALGRRRREDLQIDEMAGLRFQARSEKRGPVG